VRTAGFWVASAIVDKESKYQAVDIIRNVLKEVKTNGISNKVLETTKNYIRGQRLMEEESVLNQAQTLSILESLGLGYKYYLERDARLANVNVKILHDLAKEYFNEDNYFVQIMI
jgi:predicted Zn-dependent peptidase